jgi:hypothetical protein
MPGRPKKRPVVSQRRHDVTHLSTASKLVLWPNKPLIYRVSASLSMGVKRTGRETNHSAPSTAEVHSKIYLQVAVLN